MRKPGWILALMICLPIGATAMPIKIKRQSPHSFMIEAKIPFGRTDFTNCGRKMMRKAQTLEYSCTLPIPWRYKISQLRQQISPAKVAVNFGGVNRAVEFKVSPDARTVTMQTAFDPTGIDFEISKFNDDFFNVYAQVAEMVMSRAMAKHPLMLKVMETR